LFRLGLEERGFTYVLQVHPTATAHPADALPAARPYSGRSRPPVPAYPDPPSTLREPALGRRLVWRKGTRKTKNNPTAAMRSHFLAIHVRPANRNIPRTDNGSLPEAWLIAEWPPDEPEPVKYWLSNIDINTPLKTLVRLAKIRWRTRLPRTQIRSRRGPFRRTLPHRLAPPRHPRPRPSLLHPPPPTRPKSGCAGLTVYAVLRELQRLLTVMAGACHICQTPLDNTS
jgi:DDE superfamily endonuclease